MSETEIVHTALENLRKNNGIEGVWKAVQQKELDGQLTLTANGKMFKYLAEVKKDVKSHQLQQLIKLNEKYSPLIVIAPRLFPKIKGELRHHNISYLEGNGNLFLTKEESMIWIDTNKPIAMAKETGSRAFTKTGLKVVFQFLLDESWVNKPYRQIAERTGTGIGNITNIIAGLRQEEFLLPVGRNEYKVINKQLLLNKWIAAYDTRLKPTLKIGTFRFLKDMDWSTSEKMVLQSGKTRWGGEAAADLLTHYLIPAELTLYTAESRSELIKNYRLIPDEKGPVKAYKSFWAFDESNDNTVPPVLVYADLMNTHDPRCVETAQKIYDAYLQTQY